MQWKDLNTFHWDNASWKVMHSSIPTVKMSGKKAPCQWRIWRWVVNPEERFKTKGDYVLSEYTSAFWLSLLNITANFLEWMCYFIWGPGSSLGWGKPWEGGLGQSGLWVLSGPWHYLICFKSENLPHKERTDNK